jgi:hypothetical protein
VRLDKVYGMSRRLQTPFEDGGFSFDPKKITVYAPVNKRDRRPGDLFGATDLNRSRSLLEQTRVASIYRALRYNKSFRARAISIFLMFFLPGVIATVLLMLRII